LALYVVATPIGNLGDLSPRALDTLRAADAVVAEDTRRTRELLSHFDIHKPLLSLPGFDEAARLSPLVERLRAGESLALVSDAGTPAVSDPGARLAEAAWEAGVPVVPIPGASAALAALSAAGLHAERFFVAGFLPRRGEERRRVLSELSRVPAALVVFEAGSRTGGTLADLAAALGPRRAAVARELTKVHEEIVRGALPELAARFEQGARGEVVVVVEAPRDPVEAQLGLAPLDEALKAGLASGRRLSELAAELAGAYRRPRQEIYARALAIRASASQKTPDE